MRVKSDFIEKPNTHKEIMRRFALEEAKSINIASSFSTNSLLLVQKDLR